VVQTDNAPNPSVTPGPSTPQGRHVVARHQTLPVGHRAALPRRSQLRRPARRGPTMAEVVSSSASTRCFRGLTGAGRFRRHASLIVFGATARAENRRFGLLSALCTHTKMHRKPIYCEKRSGLLTTSDGPGPWSEIAALRWPWSRWGLRRSTLSLCALRRRAKE
jgi:hypothetical protein